MTEDIKAYSKTPEIIQSGIVINGPAIGHRGSLYSYVSIHSSQDTVPCLLTGDQTHSVEYACLLYNGASFQKGRTLKYMTEWLLYLEMLCSVK